MTNYYFLANSLPSIEIGESPDLSFVELGHMLDLNLGPEDKQKVVTIRHYFDLLNLRLLWLEQNPDPRGNYSEGELDEALLVREGFGDYVFDFLDKFEGRESRLRHFGEVVETFFREEVARHTGFLHDYFEFERELRLVMLGFRAKRLHRDVLVELQHEDPSDQIVAQIVAQKDTKEYEPPYGYESLKTLFEQHYDDPIALHKAMCHYRFNRVDTMIQEGPFSIEMILAYAVQLIIVEQWQELDAQEGEKILKAIVKDVS